MLQYSFKKVKLYYKALLTFSNLMFKMFPLDCVYPLTYRIPGQVVADVGIKL